MRKIYFLIFLLLPASQIFAQALFTYGTDAVTKDEFLRAYNKNKSSGTDKEKSLREYMELYSRFKLKVKAAKEMKLDTLQQLQTDVDGFKSQVEEGYMNDEKEVNALVHEAFVRSQKEIHLIHFYVPVNAAMTVADSAKAYKLIQDAYTELNKGRSDYENIASELTAQSKMIVTYSDLGYITALSIPYEYENIAYGLKPGAVCTPYKTKKAWHLFKNTEERTSMGKWKVAQILFIFPPDATDNVKKVMHEKADSVYKLIQAGADFAETAKKFSQDKITYQTGGELPEFGSGKYSLSFENAVFALKKDGDVSAPILTNFGWHIIKRLKQTPLVSSDTDENYMFDLKQKVQQDTRINVAKAKFLKNVLATINYKRSAIVRDEELYRFADSVVKNEAVGKYPINALPLFSFNNTIVKGIDWLNYAKDYGQNNSINTKEAFKELFDKFLSSKAMDYYRKNLERYNNDFKYQMQEFKEGNMLFEIMERNIWSKAANDSIGLSNYYKAHPSKYLWDASADVVIYNCSDKRLAESAVAAIKEGKNWKQISEESNATIQADSGRYELTQLPVSVKPESGSISELSVNATDGTTSFVQVIKPYPANQQRSFEEARGLVINEYQNYLEEKWIDSLKKKYPIKVNEAVFQSLLK